jgi:hypothetical protein
MRQETVSCFEFAERYLKRHNSSIEFIEHSIINPIPLRSPQYRVNVAGDWFSEVNVSNG